MSLALEVCREGSETLLHGEFGTYPPKGIRYALSLTWTELHIQRLVPKPDSDHRTVVRLVDVAGCHTLRSHTLADRSAYFCIYAYPLKKRKVAVSAGRARQRTARTFQVDGAESFVDNQAMAEKWAAAIKCLVLGIPISSETEIAPSLLPRPRRLLLLLNPFGGKGNALQWCQAHVLPMITEADISFNLIQTERQNHARELVQSISLAEWDGIVAISGDGLLFEVINGLLERPDWEEAIKMPVGILPCGSGNALAGAINDCAGFEQVLGQELLTNCTLMLCHGAVTPMDLVSISTLSGSRSFSFLSVAWGFISDVDIESEKYRHMGAARFTVGTVVRLASLNTYRGRLSYLPAPDTAAHRPILRSITMSANGSLPFQRMPLHRTVSDMGLCEKRHAFSIRGAEPPEDPTPSPSSPPSSGFQPSSFNFEALHEELVADGKGPRLATPMMVAPNRSSARCVHGPPDQFLAPLDQPVPKSWVTVEDDFVMLIRVPVRAFRLEPLTRKGILTVDGERVEYGPIQGEVHHSVANLITGIHKTKITTF
ncbi:PREDICTED: sphingosine kinase 2 [Gekko japonicus]|uniref:Sphingosine kinase 2 n=1 Tax=Gekko japonicus TaxID=146911 RepID=A0ABM1K1G1_GEKJA|nr:PREDICTED: sphingosine kinase 2 [Gekko japonicus]